MLIENVRIIQSQSTIQCCSPFAILTAVEAIGAMNGKNWNFSRLFLYYNSRKLQGRIGQHGVNLIFTLKALEDLGCCDEYHWPFMHHRENKEPTNSAYRNAETFRPLKYKSLSNLDFKYYIDNNIPVVVSVRLGFQFLNLKGNLYSQVYSPVDDSSNTFIGNHAIAIVGYNDTICGGSWIIANSKGLMWGDHGFGIIPYSCSKDILEAYSIESFSNLSPVKKISDN